MMTFSNNRINFQEFDANLFMFENTVTIRPANTRKNTKI
jgi:hypothetical protein